MKFTALAVFLVFSLQNAYAIKPASSQEYLEIHKLIQKATDKQAEIDKNRLSRQTAKPDKIASIEQEYANLMKERKTAYEQAIWLTIQAYHILPFVDGKPTLPRGISYLRSPENGKRITWIPIFEDNGPKSIQNEIGHTIAVGPLEPEIAGNTASDGVSRILPTAFTSPAALASIIIHEKIHFNQFITPRTGRDLTPAEREVEAYTEEKRLLKNGTLGRSEEVDERLEEVDIMISKKQKLADIQRAAVTKAKGLPIDEYSLASHSGDELNKLVAQAREQIKIANKDHDDRLLASLLDLTSISCRNPGSVTPAMLAKLGQPHDENFWRSAAPNDCNDAYLYLAQGGRDARALRSLSTPPAAVQPLPPPVQSIPTLPPEPRAVQPVRGRKFSSMLPLAKDLAVTACRSSGQAAVDSDLTRPFHEIDFSPEFDDRTARDLSIGLGDCENRLFRRLIEVIRSGEGPKISAEWVQKTATAYRPAPVNSPWTPAPPANGGGDPCRDNGNVRCP